MKRFITSLLLLCAVASATAQDCYWVFLTDKQGSTFDPYAYFDAKAIERYRQCGADLYDITNYPLTQQYVDGVNALATDEVGESRWMNAMGVVATAEQAAAIGRLPYVLRVQPISSDFQLAAAAVEAVSDDNPVADTTLSLQVLRMQGDLFRAKGIDGHGVRIAVFDGGFPRVNTHAAFKHLRDDHRILKTWNFPNKKENVYGWNSHGTMTLSCIAGRMNGKDLGLATGAEFLLARTEVNAEPFKEEIWWMQAVEWADRNGANIISSSLGYGKDRYYTRDMDGKSYVAKAANMAARKGMLVVNSAGNEAVDISWQYIITPSDADSALCVGGIEHSLTEYEHISFASFGPSADGRQKPNVCAIAHTWAASPRNDGAFQMVYGTSFSCPLVAGFAACAWQASPGKTAMQMFHEIERSADLYPYCDYAFGYGVPQASYFTGDRKPQTPSFRFEKQSSMSVSVIPTRNIDNAYIFYKDVDSNGKIITYGQQHTSHFDTAMSLDFTGGHHIVVSLDGYSADYRFDSPSDADPKKWTEFRSTNPNLEYTAQRTLRRTPATDVPNERHLAADVYFSYGLCFDVDGNAIGPRFWSDATRIGVRVLYKFSKAYGIGLAVEVGKSTYSFRNRDVNELEANTLHLANQITSAVKQESRKLIADELSLELFQRVRFVPAGMMHKGLHWDLGAFISTIDGSYRFRAKNNDAVSAMREYSFIDLKAMDDYNFSYGITTRFTYDIIGVYGRFRLNQGQQVQLPRLEVGVQLMF